METEDGRRETGERQSCILRRQRGGLPAPRALTLRFALSLSQNNLGEGPGALRAGCVGRGVESGVTRFVHPTEAVTTRAEACW